MGRQQASKLYKTKRKSKDLDQILCDDMKSKASVNLLENQKFDEYLPGLGQNYCVPCAKHFETNTALNCHQRQKVHKRQLKNLRFGPYTSEEANSGAGLDVDKFLAKQQQINNIVSQPEILERLVTKKQYMHKKFAKESTSIEMDIEQTESSADLHNCTVNDGEKSTETEISV